MPAPRFTLEMPARGRRAAGVTLVATVERELERRIRKGPLKPGDRLPTEQGLIDDLGVSRTVVREAVARLQARGMVEVRHGAGVFVAKPDKSTSVNRVVADLSQVATVLDVLEIRLAVEVEAAALAAARRTPSQEMRIREAFQAIGAAIKRGEQATEADFAFHRAIAEATNNRIFVEFLQGLGQRSIPRAQVRAARRPDAAYLQKVQQEHAAVLEAIAAGAPDKARDAMRRHLQESQKRYRALLPK
jgi:DNA-binding FadR family transcriptional regulator